MPTLFTAIFKLFDLVDRDGSISLMRICQHAAKLWKDMPDVIFGALPVGGVMKFVKQETNMEDILFHTAALQSLSSFVAVALAYQASAQDGIYLDETRLKKVNDLAQLFANLEVRAYVNHFVDSPEQSLAEEARTVTQFIEAH
ncbi:hypothetical protein BLNAU_15876 [Blattamonas nauphoetae]|uniref:Uncharacterized protein n=1 Tax=Blattamonas nauphoetae TaxID=2049346 RepID=A0ABQ9XG55_9EUKA|nr:hypothetical protein BLNAU_15876 [Blattamonas nauphoetae]